MRRQRGFCGAWNAASRASWLEATRAVSISCSAYVRQHTGRRSPAACKSRHANRESARNLLGIVENYAQRVTRTPVNSANPMPQVNPVIAARAFHRAIARSENDGLPLIGGNDLAFGLRARLLLH